MLYKLITSILSRNFSTSRKAIGKKVAVLGASGGIGQPLSLLMKMNERVSQLSLYDILNTHGVAADLSHINTHCKVIGHVGGADGLRASLQEAEVVIIPAGVPRKPGMSRDDLFNTNASIVADLARACSEICPKAFVLIIANPVNSTVPIFAEIFKKKGVLDERKIFGVTTLDVVRASRFLAEHYIVDPKYINVPVVGGHAGATIIPLFSQASKTGDMNDEQLKNLTNRVQFGGDEVVKAKEGTGSATLSMAYAGAHFSDSLIRALEGEKGIIQSSYVRSKLYECQGVDYFSSKIELGPSGIEKIHDIGKITSYEQQLVEEALPILKTNIDKGIKFAAK